MAILTPIEIAYRIAAAGSMKETASDADASKFASIYPTLKGNGALIKSGTRINKNGKLFRARVDLWDTEENTPENVPSLWEEILYKEGYRIVIGNITAENPFCLGDRAWFGDHLYESIHNGVNVWSPADNPGGWKLIK